MQLECKAHTNFANLKFGFTYIYYTCNTGTVYITIYGVTGVSSSSFSNLLYWQFFFYCIKIVLKIVLKNCI